MAKVVVVTSGKGGVGKTTTTAALGAALAQSGQKVALVDFDVGLRNLDLVMGAERRVVYDLINVMQGVAKLPQALIRDKRIENLWLLPASQTRDKDALDRGRRRAGDRGTARDASIGSSATAPPASSGARRSRCGSPTRPSSSPTRKSPRCAIPIASSACSMPRPKRPRRASASTSTFCITRYDARARRARRDAEHRGRARNPVDAASRHHSGKPGSAARVQSRLAGDAQRSGQRRRPAPIWTRRAGSRARPCRWRSRATRSGCSTDCLDGGPHEPVQPVATARLRPGGARTIADPACLRARRVAAIPISSRSCARRSSR